MEEGPLGCGAHAASARADAAVSNHLRSILSVIRALLPRRRYRMFRRGGNRFFEMGHAQIKNRARISI